MTSRKDLIEEIRKSATIENIVFRKPYTFVDITTDYKGLAFYGAGFSKVNWPDEFNEDYGYNLAFNRAVGDIVKQVRKHEKDKELAQVEKLVEFYTSI